MYTINENKHNTQTVLSFTAPKKDGFIDSYRKENKFSEGYCLMTKEGRTLADIRIYYHPGFVCYCCAWVKIGDTQYSASDKAGGYGYHKQSAAVFHTLYKMGFRFKESFDGGGNERITDALHAIAHYLELTDYFVIKAHG